MRETTLKSYRLVRAILRIAVCCLPAAALAVATNVNLTFIKNDQTAIAIQTLVLNPGPDAQHLNNRDRDNRVMGVPLNEGDSVTVEATDTDNRKWRGTFTVPRSGRPEVDVTVTMAPLGGPAPRSQPSRSSGGGTVTDTPALLSGRRISTGSTLSQTELEKIPSARNPWAILQQTPGIIVDRISVGGNEPAQPAQTTETVGGAGVREPIFVIDGQIVTDPRTAQELRDHYNIDTAPSATEFSWETITPRIGFTYNVKPKTGSFNFDGLIINAMTIPGWTPTYYDFDAFEEMQVPDNKMETFNTGGVTLNMVTRRGTNEWRFRGRYLLTDENWQATDTQRQQSRSLELGADVGGPIVRDKLWIWYGQGSADVDITNLTDFTKLENYANKLNAQLTSTNSLVGFYHYGDKYKIGRDTAPSRPQETTWNQTGPTPIYKLEDPHIFSSSFFLSGLSTYVGGGFQLIQPVSLYDIGTADGSTGFLNTLPQSQSATSQLDASSFFNSGSVAHELRFRLKPGQDMRDNIPDANAFTSVDQMVWKWSNGSNALGEQCYPTSQGLICGGGPGRVNEQGNPPNLPPEQLMLQSPTDFTMEHLPPTFGEGHGPKLARGKAVKMPNYAWVFPGNWRTDVAMGFAQRKMSVTAPTGLTADHIVMLDDTVFARPMPKSVSTRALADALWRTAQSAPQNCKPGFGGAPQPARTWMLIRTLDLKQSRWFAIQLTGRSGWVELDGKGQPRQFGLRLRYDPPGHTLWLTGGTSRLNRELVYSIDLGSLSRSWLSLRDPDGAYDAKSNPPQLCGTGKPVTAPAVRAVPVKTAVKAAAKPGAIDKNSDRPRIEVPVLTACAGIQNRAPAGLIKLALKSPMAIPGAGYHCEVAAPPYPGNPVRTKLSLRDSRQSYHPLYNPFQAACTCGS